MTERSLSIHAFCSHFNISNHYQSHSYNFVNFKQLLLLHNFIKKRIRVTGAVYFVFVSSNVLRCLFRFILSRRFHFFLLIRSHVVINPRHCPPQTCFCWCFPFDRKRSMTVVEQHGFYLLSTFIFSRILQYRVSTSVYTIKHDCDEIHSKHVFCVNIYARQILMNIF